MYRMSLGKLMFKRLSNWETLSDERLGIHSREAKTNTKVELFIDVNSKLDFLRAHLEATLLSHLFSLV